MSRSSARRAQASPLTALVALLAVAAGLSLYAGVLDTSLRAPGGPDPTAGTVADRTLDSLAPAGVATPDRLAGLRDAATRSRVVPAGHRVNVTLTVRGDRWRAGPSPPARSGRPAEAVRTTSVRLAPGRVVPGRLRVVVWS